MTYSVRCHWNATNVSKKYLLTGYLGANNLGDECMLRCFLGLFDPFPQVSFTIFSYGACYDAPRIETKYHSNDPCRCWENIVQASRNVDGVIWVGGNCFTDVDGDGDFRLMLRCKLRGQTFYYIGIGVDEMHRPLRRLKTIMALNLADGIIMRDAFSLALGRRWCPFKKIESGPDLGEQYLIKHPVHDSGTATGMIVVSWRNLEKNLPLTHLSLIERLAVKLALLAVHTGREISVFNSDDLMDRETNYYLVQCLRQNGIKHLVFHQELALEDKLSLLRSAWVVVTARLHTGVAGVLYGKPTAIFNYSKKVEQFAARVGRRVLTMSGPDDFEMLGDFCLQGSQADVLTEYLPTLDDQVYTQLAAKLAGTHGRNSA